MLKLVFGGRWYVQFVLAMAVFGAAWFFYGVSQEMEAEKAKARAAGMPAAVSLSVFDPKVDVHAADEVHVTGWFNPDFNYQLTEERRKRSDTVRRMFVMFGPEDAPDSKQVRAVVMLQEGEVERFLDGMIATISGQVGGNPVFSINGTAATSATLSHMAVEALAEQGLTKAPGFRYLEIWPEGGRDVGLAPDAETGTSIAAAVAGFGVLLLLVAGVKFKGRHAVPVQARPAAFASAGFAGIQLQSQTPQAYASTPPAEEPLSSARKRPFWMPAPESFAFLGMAIFFGVVSTWTGHWQLTILAVFLGIAHFIARIKKAVDKGVQTVASTIVQAKTELSQNRLTNPTLAGTGPVTRPQSPVNQLIELGQTTFGKKVTMIAGVVACVAIAPVVFNDKLLDDLGAKFFSQSSNGNGQEPAPEVVQPVSAGPADTEVAPMAGPAVTTEVAAAPPEAVSTEQDLIPEAASLRPKAGEIGAPAAPEVVQAEATVIVETVQAEPVPAALVAAEPVPAALVAAEPVPAALVAAEPVPAEPMAAPVVAAIAEPAVTADADQSVAPVAEASAALASTDASVSATAPADQADAAAEPPVVASASGLGSLGSLAFIAPIVGAVILAVAAFALMRGRQAAPPAVFAGRDPWAKLANQARASAGA